MKIIIAELSNKLNLPKKAKSRDNLRVKFKKIKQKLSVIISTLITEHSKFFLILILSLLAFLVMYLYISPPSQDIEHAPIQFLPGQICNWRGADIPTGIRFKNNQYKSAQYFDPNSGIEVQFVSYQRRNEKYNQIHYPEDCLRSVGIFEFKENLVPIEVAGRKIIFKRLYGEDNNRGILHYYVILTKQGDDFFYAEKNPSLFKLLVRKYSLKRAQQQIFRFSCQLRHKDKYKLVLADQKIKEFIQNIPKEFWPK